MASEQEKATFSLNLESNAAKVGADLATQLETLKGKLFEEMAALKGMNTALRNLKGGGVVAEDSVKQLQQKIVASKAVVASAQQEYLNLGGSFSALKPASKVSVDGIDKLVAATEKASGAATTQTSKIGELTNRLLKGMSVQSAFTAATLALAASAGIAAVALTKMGIAAADARRNEALALEGASKLRVGLFFLGDGLVRARDSGAFVQQQVDKLTNSFDVSREQAIGFASSLQNMGMRGGNLQVALEGLALAQQTQGEAGVEQFKAMIGQAVMFGGSVKKVADDFKARLGPIAAKQMLSIGAQVRMVQKNISTLFKDLKIDAFLTALRTITELFGQNTASGYALKTLTELIVQPLINFLTDWAPAFRSFFEGVQLAVLDLTIFVLKLRNKFLDVFGPDILGNIDKTELGLQAGILTVQTLAAAMGVLALNTALWLAPMLLVPAIIMAGVIAWRYVINHIKEFGESIEYLLDKGDAWARDMIDGLVNGIKKGIGRVIGAVKDLGNQAMKAFKATLGIASPSKEFAKLGKWTAEGAEQGIKAGSPGVQSAAEDMLPVPQASAGPAGSAKTSSGGNMNFFATFTIGSSADASDKSVQADLEQKVKRWVTEAIVAASIEMGVGQNA